MSEMPKPAHHEPWVILGYLHAVIESNGCITTQDWDAALESAERAEKP